MKKNNLLHDIKHLSYTDLREKYQYIKSNEKVTTDIKILSATELRVAYVKEYKAWDNIKQKSKIGFSYSQEFETFAGFLLFLGKAENKKMSIDRIDPHDTEYAPGKVRWADKKTQSLNQVEHVSPFPSATREQWEHNYKLDARRNHDGKVIEPREYYFFRIANNRLEQLSEKVSDKLEFSDSLPDDLQEEYDKWAGYFQMAKRALERYKREDRSKIEMNQPFPFYDL